MLRSGRIADYLGPVVSYSSREADAIIASLASSTSATIFWDIPRADTVTCNRAQMLGFEPVRVLTRMVLGQDTIKPNLELQYAISDPATG